MTDARKHKHTCSVERMCQNEHVYREYLPADTEHFERTPSLVFLGEERVAENENRKEKAHIKPHEIIIKRPKPAINAFQWHIMIDSIFCGNLFSAGLWPLDQPYIIHINIDRCAS